MHHRIVSVLAASAVALLLASAPALAQVNTFSAELTGAEEVPPNDSPGTGTLEASFDPATMVLTWTVTYEGLTGDATAAHFHGPADPGANAPPVVPVENLASPIEGQATLDEAQAEELRAGKWYFNLHTEQYPDGEIRGQVVSVDD